MSEKNNYILNQYKQLGILKTDYKNNDWFNPNIYPDEGNISFCTSCKEDYENFKKTDIYDNMEVIIKDGKACLWYEWYVMKIKNTCPSAKIVKNKLKKRI